MGDKFYNGSFECEQCKDEIPWRAWGKGEDSIGDSSTVVKIFGQNGKPQYFCCMQCLDKYFDELED